jgi:predicted porin
MKKHLYVALSVVLLISGSSKAQEASIAYYGKFDISLQSMAIDKALTTPSQRTSNVQSNGSRFGLTFNNGLNPETKLFGQLESALDFNTEQSGERHFSQRNTFVGIKTSWGQLLAGRHDTPLKLAQGNIDLFSDADSQMYALHRGENRVSDMFMYKIKPFEPVNFTLAVVNNGSSSRGKYGISAALSYQHDGIYSAVAIDKDILDYDIVRWVASYQYQHWMFSGLWQRARASQLSKLESNGDAIIDVSQQSQIAGNSGYTLSARYAFSAASINLQYSKSNEIVQGARLLSLGADWQVSKRTKIYAFYTDKQASESGFQGSLISLGVKYAFISQ